MTSTSWKPSLFQAAAQNRVYITLAATTIQMFAAVLAAPLAFQFAYFIFSILTNRMCVMTIIMTTLLSIAAASLAVKLSSSEKTLDRWLQEKASRVPIYAFFLSCLISRAFGSPKGFYSLWESWSFMEACRFSLRLAVSVAVVHFVIVMRYISPISIMRLSSVPLVMDPLASTLHRIFLQPWSIAEPSASVVQSSTKPPLFHGRRYIRPTLRTLLLQLVISGLAGALTATTWSALVNIPSRYAVLLRVASSIVTALTVSFPPNHEMNYNAYQSIRKVLLVRINVWAIMASGLVVPVGVLFLSSLFGSLGNGVEMLITLMYLSLTCVITWLVIQLVEGWLQLNLFSTIDIARSIDEICPDSGVVAHTHAVLHALVSDMDIAREIQAAERIDERREQKRCMELSKALAPAFLSLPSGYIETPFEEDLFRMTVLEALAGTRTTPVNDWLAPQRKDRRSPLLSYMFAKGLCVLLGAWGPGFFTAAEFALKALSGFIVDDIRTDGAIRDWRGFNLALLVPTTLQCIFSLHNGLVLYQKYQLAETLANVTSASGTGSLMESCELVTKTILSCLQSPLPQSNVLTDVVLDEDCRLWIQELVKGQHNETQIVKM